MPVVDRRKPTEEELKNYKRYRLLEGGISPMAVPGMAGGGYVAEGLEHDERGYPAASNHSNHLEMTKKRYQKFEAVEEMANEVVRMFGDPKPEVGIIGWVSTEGVIREAVDMALREGYSVGALHPSIIYPQPLEKLKVFIRGCKSVIIPEVNYTGQFANLLRKRFAYNFVQLNKCTGLPFTPREIFEKIKEVVEHVHNGRPAHTANV